MTWTQIIWCCVTLSVGFAYQALKNPTEWLLLEPIWPLIALGLFSLSVYLIGLAAKWMKV